MNMYTYVSLRENPQLMDRAAAWFHSKWGVPKEAYLECMEAYLQQETELGWFLCMDGDQIVGGLGVIENDFHDRPDLTPNVCAVYTEETHRGQGIAGKLLPPFVAISGLGENAAWDIMKGREGKEFLSVEEFSAACPKVSKTHIQMLKDAGAFGSLPDTSQVSFF